MSQDQRDKFAVIDGGGQSNANHPKPNLKIVDGGGRTKHGADALPANQLLFAGRKKMAALLDISPTHFDDQVRKGVLPKPSRLGRSVRWNVQKTVAAADAALDIEATDADDWLEATQ